MRSKEEKKCSNLSFVDRFTLYNACKSIPISKQPQNHRARREIVVVLVDYLLKGSICVWEAINSERLLIKLTVINSSLSPSISAKWFLCQLHTLKFYN